MPGQKMSRLKQTRYKGRRCPVFISVDDRPLIADQISQLSAGAVKLLMVIRAEPNASQKRYVDLVGMCERSVRNFGRELLDSGLVCRVTTREGAGEYTS